MWSYEGTVRSYEGTVCHMRAMCVIWGHCVSNEGTLRSYGGTLRSYGGTECHIRALWDHMGALWDHMGALCVISGHCEIISLWGNFEIMWEHCVIIWGNYWYGKYPQKWCRLGGTIFSVWLTMWDICTCGLFHVIFRVVRECKRVFWRNIHIHMVSYMPWKLS